MIIEGGSLESIMSRVYPRVGQSVLILQAIGTGEVINSLLKLSAGTHYQWI
jgi:hypothetical protein